MKKTLRENPEDFWYLNNGITIIIQNETAFDYSKKSRICLDYKSPGIISVINGAQTISTAAEFCIRIQGLQIHSRMTYCVKMHRNRRRYY